MATFKKNKVPGCNLADPAAHLEKAVFSPQYRSDPFFIIDAQVLVLPTSPVSPFH